MINGIHSVLNTVMDWAIKNTIQEVLVLDGIPVQDIPRSERQTIILESNEMDQIMRNDENNDNNLSISNSQDNASSNFNRSTKDAQKKFTTFIGGIAGGLLSACLSYQIPCAAILVPALNGIPDPEGASLLIESYNSIIKDENLKINSAQLREQGQNLKRQLEQIIKSEQEQREHGTMTGQREIYG
jgi:uncharacterized protein